MIGLRRRHRLLIATFLVGGVVLAYFSVASDVRFAVALPCWLVFAGVAQLWLLRCPRCRWPSVLGFIRIAGRRLWVWLPGVNDQCAKCGKVLN